jgi:hypothetical protein
VCELTIATAGGELHWLANKSNALGQKIGQPGDELGVRLFGIHPNDLIQVDERWASNEHWD